WLAHTLYLSLHYYCSSYTSCFDSFTLSLHDALPIYLFGFQAPAIELPLVRVPGVLLEIRRVMIARKPIGPREHDQLVHLLDGITDRKSTRLNSSHQIISYAVFCLKIKTTSAEFDRSI